MGFALPGVVKDVAPFSGGRREGRILEIITVIFIVCLAVGYLIWRYVRRSNNNGVCECDNMECPLKGAESVPMGNTDEGMVCHGKRCNGDPLSF
jgi:hypothetical protein